MADKSNNQTIKQQNNLYVHFPFCRRKCSYCALYSRTGVSQSDRDAYVRRLASEIGSIGSLESLESLGSLGSIGALGSLGALGSIGTGQNVGLTDLVGTPLNDSKLTLKDSNQTLADSKLTLKDSNQTLADSKLTLKDSNQTLADSKLTLKDSKQTLIDSNLTLIDSKLKTVYFGGGSPALCDLSVLAPVLRPLCGDKTEFTVELHPLDVTEAKLAELKDLGVNRISMGVQSLDDAVLADMGRGYTVDEAERAFALVKNQFDNAGVDLIVGYPGDQVKGEGEGERWKLKRLESWGLRHCSVYTLQNERGLKNVPDDDRALDLFQHIAICLNKMGLERYEISNFAAPGFECRHNLAVWRGEDYIGLGDGACGRIGRTRTKFGKTETVSAEFDEKERRLFRLRTREGLDASGHPEWVQPLAEACRNGLLVKTGEVYRLTERGMEVCDSILADLV